MWMTWGESLQLSAPCQHDRSNEMSKNKILQALSTMDRKLYIAIIIYYCYLGGVSFFLCISMWLMQYVCLVARSCLTLSWPHGLQPTRLLCPWDFSGKDTGVRCQFLLQVTFPMQELNPNFPTLQVDSLLLSHQGSPCSVPNVHKRFGEEKKNLPKFNFQITLPPDPRRALGPISDCPFLSAKEAGDAPCSHTGKPGGATEKVESRAPPGDMGLDSS